MINIKNEKFNSRNQRCMVCGTNRGVIHKYRLNICRRCFREDAYSIGFRKYS